MKEPEEIVLSANKPCMTGFENALEGIGPLGAEAELDLEKASGKVEEAGIGVGVEVAKIAELAVSEMCLTYVFELKPERI